MTGTRRPPDRGQLVIVAGLVLGVAFIAMAVHLNGVLFLEHRSTAEGRTADPVEAAAAATRAASGAMMAVNVTDESSHAAVAMDVTAAVEQWERLAATQYAARGVDVSLAVQDVTVATRITDADENGTLTSADGQTDWTLATNVTELGAARLRLASDGLTATGDPGPFRLVVENVSATWSIAVTNASGDAEVVVDGPGGSSTCTAPSGTTTVDLVNGTVDGSPCPHLAVAGAFEAPSTIRYENASNATGTYVLTVVNETVMPATRYDDGSQPRTRPLAYRTTLEFRYRDADIEYVATRTVESEQ